jgi:ligand-binding sensor domain-containing protein/signal transduction histidine kinase/DNA-binding response OmpR family regulator
LKSQFLLLLAGFLLAGNSLTGQSYYFRHYQVEDGLSHNTVTSILQDKEGILWLGTKDGLNRFDGYTYKVFRSDSEDPHSIGSNFIQSLYEYNGQLWVGTSKGLYKYNSKTENFSLINDTANNNIKDILQDNNGNIWFIADFTPARYNVSTQNIQYYDIQEYFSATSICNDADGNIWFSAISGTINKYDSINDAFTSYDVFEHSEESSSKWVERIYPAGKRSILVGTQSQGIKLFDLNTLTYQDILTKDEHNAEIFVRDFLKSSNEEYWVATESGIYIYNMSTGAFINLRKNYNNPYSISDNAVYALCSDKEGGIWAGTYFGGVNYYPKQYTSFDKFFPVSNENSISGNAVREITQDKYGNFWIGTEDAGLNRYDPETGVFTHFKPNGSDTSLSYHNIHGLLATGEELWIGTFEHGLDVMDIKTGRVLRHYSAGAHPKSLKSNFIHSIHETRSGKILIGTSLGLYHYNRESDNFSAIPEFPTNYHYTFMLDDYQGGIWAGTLRDGLYYFDPKTNKKEYFKHEPGNNKSISNNYITSIFEDSKKNLWITTEDGLCKYNPDENNFNRYNTKNGFPSNVIYSILEDDKKNLWISTSKGLVRFNPVTEDIKVFTKAHGLLSDQLNYNSAYKDSEGRMYFGSVKGLISFNPSGFIKNTFIPPIHITGFQVHNKELLVNKKGSPLNQSITYTDKLTLNHNQSSFSIDFAALSYTAPHMAEYAYKMEGIDKEWTYLKTNRKVYFTELAPGSYTFKVKASNSSGLWNEEATQLKIEILPPFWASSWAYLLYIMFGLLMVYYGVRSYHRHTQKKNRRKIKLLENEKEKEIYQAKIEFFTNVAHEIRTPLTLIKGPLEKIINTPISIPTVTDNLKIMEKNTQRLLDLTNQLLDFRKTEINGFSLTFVKANICELLEEVNSRFKPVAEQKNISFTLDLTQQPLYAHVDPEAFTKIFSNLLNNAVKYAKSKVIVSLKPFNLKEDKTFTIMVKNDGPFIPLEMKERIFEPFFRLEENKEQTGTGIGLPLARSLTELHSGILALNTDERDMNSFSLTLPIHQKNEFKLYKEDPEEVSASDEEAEVGNPDDIKPVILLAEDNKEMLDFIADGLNKDYTVIKACNGEKALNILKEQNVQLVISDVVMPVMNGFELCRQIKTILDYSHIPIILLTAKSTMQAKIEGLETGADAYIEKPFSPDHLQVQVANLLTNRSKIKEYFSSSPLTHIKSMAYSKADEQFLKKLDGAIYENIADTELNVEHLAEIMNMSRPTLYRKIKAISNLTPNELINIARLKKAAKLLAEGDYRIYEVANIVGYNSQTSFGRNFQKQFGMTPSEYAATLKDSLEKAG